MFSRFFRNLRGQRPAEFRFEALRPGEPEAAPPLMALPAPPREAAPSLAPLPAPRDAEADGRRDALRQAFTPTRPLVSAGRLAGREQQFARIMRALREQMAHVAIYAERGCGKTSLSNLVAEALRADGVVVARFTCAAATDYDALMRGLMRDLPRSLLARPVIEAHRAEGCEAALPDGRLQPRDLLDVPERLVGGLAKRQLVLMVDEFDRVEDVHTRTAVADTLKQVSDRGLPMSFVLVGVSDSLEQLLGHHPSVQRNLVGVPLPLLGPAEMEKLLRQGAEAAGLVLPPSALAAMSALARGVPYVGQLLGLHAGHAALSRGATTVTGADLDAAIAVAVDEADLRIAGAFEEVTQGGRNEQMVHSLRAVAAGVQDPYGRFRAEIAAPGNTTLAVAGRQIPIAMWDRLVTAGIVRPCIGAGSGLFTFSEATFGHYVLLRAAREVSLAGHPGHIIA